MSSSLCCSSQKQQIKLPGNNKIINETKAPETAFSFQMLLLEKTKFEKYVCTVELFYKD